MASGAQGHDNYNGFGTGIDAPGMGVGAGNGRECRQWGRDELGVRNARWDIECKRFGSEPDVVTTGCEVVSVRDIPWRNVMRRMRWTNGSVVEDVLAKPLHQALADGMRVNSGTMAGRLVQRWNAATYCGWGWQVVRTVQLPIYNKSKWW